MLYRGLKSLDKLDVIEEAERVAAAKIIVLINVFNFSKILLDFIKAEAF
jgi:hypothetical protein